jgi:hypothetical protein
MVPNRMLKTSVSFVLAALIGSTYRKEYASPLRWLRPRWTAILNILQGVFSFHPKEDNYWSSGVDKVVFWIGRPFRYFTSK